jgi:hypothetical protein
MQSTTEVHTRVINNAPPFARHSHKQTKTVRLGHVSREVTDCIWCQTWVETTYKSPINGHAVVSIYNRVEWETA